MSDVPTTSEQPADASPRSFRFSIRELLLAVTGIGGLLWGFTQYGALGGFSVATALGFLLVVFGQDSANPRVARIGWFVLIPSFCLMGAIFSMQLLFGIGQIYSPDNWPHELSRMAEVGNVTSTDAKVYGLGRYIDSEFAWRITISSDNLPNVINEFGFVKVPPKSVPKEFWRVFPNSWRPKNLESSQYWAIYEDGLVCQPAVPFFADRW
jgi:hypothetical protein